MAARVSVVIPTVGASSHLAAAVSSALAAVSADDRIIVVWDRAAGRGSRPEIARQDPRLVVLESPGRGVSAARNAGMAAAPAAYVAFLDDDDLWLPGHLQVLLEAHGGDPRCLLVGTHPRLFDGEPPRGNGPGPDAASLPPMLPGWPAGRVDLTALVGANPFTPSAVLLHAERLEAGERFDEGMTHLEDWDLWLRLVRREPGLFVDRLTVLKREHAAAASRRRRAMALGGLAALGRLSRAGVPAELDVATLRRREARLYHELAYACLIEGDTAAARMAARQALGRRPAPRTLAYWLLSLAPAGIRRAALALPPGGPAP